MKRADLAIIIVAGIVIWFLWPQKKVKTFYLEPVVITLDKEDA